MSPLQRRSAKPITTDSAPNSSHEKSSEKVEPQFLIVGRIVRPHGVRGEMAMLLMTDYPERLSRLKTLYIGEQHVGHTVKSIRPHRKGMLLAFDEVLDRDHAEQYRDEFVFVAIAQAVPLEEGEYYLYQIEGIRVIADTGEELGHITSLIETGANDVYVVKTGNGKEILLPVIPEVIRSVDVQNRVMIVHLLDGLTE